jgi:HD-GYP domain-containing protein (c-di-GMP phosphodiesterase class II)
MELRRPEDEYYEVAIVLLGDDRFRRIDAPPLRGADDADPVRQLQEHVQSQLRSGIGDGAVTAGYLVALSPLDEKAHYWARSFEYDQWLPYSPQGDIAVVQALVALGRGIDAKNRFTGGHAERVAGYAVTLAQSLGFEPERIEALRLAAQIHDVGKVAIDESVLVKESPHNLEDESELQRHSELGHAMLLGAGLPELARWIHHLHERFDGRGYPNALAARQIPVESRILHAADALENMTRPHSYRRHRPLREALAELAFGAGTRLDPELAQRLIQLVQAGKLKIPGHEAVGRGVRKPATRRVRGAMLR